MTKNYFEHGELIGQDCCYCGDIVYFKDPHKTILGFICYVAHMDCGENKND